MTNMGRYDIGYRLQDDVTLRYHQPNEAVYTYVAAAIDIAQAMLAHDTSKQALTRLALQFDNIQLQSSHFQNSAPLARQWIDWFVDNLSRNFPPVIVDYTLLHPDCFGYHPRLPWEGTLSQFPFRLKAGIHLNPKKVNDIVNAGAMNTPGGRRRFKTFLFAFAATIVHESGPHVLISWLGNGRPFTPRSIGVGGYNSDQRGESGRWFELAVFGGTMEYYRDEFDDDGQPGVPHMIASNGYAYPIASSFIEDICSRRIAFPFQVTADAQLPENKESLGKWYTGPAPNAATLMAAQLNRSYLRSFVVSQAVVRGVPENPQIRLQALA